MEDLRFTEKIHRNTRMAASDVFHMFTQSIKGGLSPRVT